MHTPGRPCGPGSHQETTVKLRSEMWQHLVRRLQGVSATGTTPTAPVSRRLIHSDTATTPVVSGRRAHGKRSRRRGARWPPPLVGPSHRPAPTSLASFYPAAPPPPETPCHKPFSLDPPPFSFWDPACGAPPLQTSGVH